MKTVLHVFILLLIAAGSVEAVTYLKSEDTIILNDGTELVGTVIFKAETMVVIMVDGAEKQIKTGDIKSIKMDPDVTGMVERRKGDEPPVRKKPEKEEPSEPGEETPEEKAEEKLEEKPEAKPVPEKKPKPKLEEAVEPRPAEEPNRQLE